MKFVRSGIAPLDRDQLRTLGSRDGWLIETTESVRCGFGGAALKISLSGGLTSHTNAQSLLDEHELTGSDGPPGTGIVAFASLPFDRTAPGRLDVPRFVVTQFKDGRAWLTCPEGADDFADALKSETAPTQATQSLRSLTYQPTPDEYAHNVALAVELLRHKEIDKVVLARAVLGSVPEPLDGAAIAARLRVREPICTIYSLPTTRGRRYVGASPELLVRRVGATFQCNPLAGTIALPPNEAPDDYHTWLLGSTKNLHEHSVLVDDLVQQLSESYDEIEADSTPSIVTLRTIAHLGTWVSGRRYDETSAPDALQLLRLLHPTAAVGGIPRADASELIMRLEQHDRGHYAGPVGWIDANGDGEWWIGIRGIIIEGTQFEAWAGAGIVSESDPIAEREETKDKLDAVLSSVLVDRV
jgi:menaquinone-specific isochorismate synthase